MIFNTTGFQRSNLEIIGRTTWEQPSVSFHLLSWMMNLGRFLLSVARKRYTFPHRVGGKAINIVRVVEMDGRKIGGIIRRNNPRTRGIGN